MPLRDIPIQAKLRRIILQISGAVLLLTFTASFIYEYVTFRQASMRELATLGKIIGANSSAALIFDTPEDAAEILAALKAEPHVVAAALYDENGKLFAHYPSSLPSSKLPSLPEKEGYTTQDSYITGYQPIIFKDKMLGTLFLKSDMKALIDRLVLYGMIALSMIIVSFLMAYLLSRKLQRSVSNPILKLAETARAISERRDYSVRAPAGGKDEIGDLTEAFNQMLVQIEEQNSMIQSFNQKLEKNIKDRTLELQAANKELEAFSYSVSHDLRAPLRSIDGYSRVVLEDYADKLDEEGIRFLNIIVKNAVRMGQLIDDLLSFSRIGKQSLTKVKLDMNALTNSVVEELKSQQGNAALTVKKMLETEADSSLIKQVLTNLVSNALKYSRKKEMPQVEIGSYNENDMNIYYVKDNGAGFDMLYYDKLFGVFQRLHNGNEFEGTGVGLALVQRIITKHDGKVWAEGKVEQGATFYFSLPTRKKLTNNNQHATLHPRP